MRGLSSHPASASSGTHPADHRALVSGSLVLIAAGASTAALGARWGHSFNVDEPFTALAAGQPLAALLETLRHDNTPVTYLALKLWGSLAGDSEGALRSFMAASYGVAVYVTGLAGLSVGGPRCGLMAAVLVATSGTVGLLHAATIRPYALLTLVAAVLAHLMLGAVRRQQPVSTPRWIAITATHLIGLFTHPIYIFLAVGSALAAWITRGRRGYGLALTGIAAAAIYLASWGWMIRATLRLPATAWLATPHAIDLWNAYLAIWGNRNGFFLAGAVMALLTLPGAARRLAADEALRLLALIALLSFAGPFLASFVKPVFHITRTATLALPWIALTASAILTNLGTRSLAALLGVSLIIGGMQYVTAARHRGDPDPTRQSVAEVLAQARCGDVLVSAGLSYAAVTYYLQRLGTPACIRHEPFPNEVAAHPGWFDGGAIARGRDAYRAEAAATADRLARTADQLFVFTKGRGADADLSELLARELPSRFRLQRRLGLKGAFFDDVAVWQREAPPNVSALTRLTLTLE